MKRMTASLALAAALLFLVVAVGQTQSGRQGVRINELRADQDGSDMDEYFELVGDPGTSLTGLTYLVIGDGTGGSGVIEEAVDLTGQSVPGSGFFVAAEDTFTLGTPDYYVSGLNFENSDRITHMLVQGFTGAKGDDLDLDDDCTLDVTPWTLIEDSVALLETPAGECVYSATTVGPDGTYMPAHVYYCPDGWEMGEFDPAVGNDTPGAENDCGESDMLAFIRHRTNDNQYLNIYDPPAAVGGDINPLLASDTWIANVGTDSEITHMAGGDIDGDGTDELIFIRQRLNGNQYLNIYGAPVTVGGDINPLLASDTWIANLGTSNEITHMTAGDIDGDGFDEIIVIRHRLNDNQYLNIYDIPTTVGGDINPLVASDLWIGNVGTSNEITHMAAGNIDGDEDDELVFIRHRSNDNQYLHVYSIPTWVGGDINPLLASDTWIGNVGTSSEIILMGAGDADGDGDVELIFLRERPNGDQYLNIYAIPTTVGGDITPLLASDLWIGSIEGSSKITHLATIM